MPTGDWVAGAKVRPAFLEVDFDSANPGVVLGGLRLFYDVVLPSGQSVGTQRSLTLPLTPGQKTAIQNLVTAALTKLNTDEGISQLVPAPTP